MTSILHLAWHDVRSQRIPLLVYASLLAIEVAWIVSGYVPPVRPAPSTTLPLVRGLMTALLTGLIIQRDALVGTTAFWLTRPIGRWSLFASKLLTLGLLLVAAPACLCGAAWWGAGLSPADGLLVARALAAEQAMVVVITAMAAVVTASLTHLVIAGIAGIALVSLVNSVLLPAIVTTWPYVGQSLGGMRPALYLGTLSAFGLLAIAHQFFTRREWRTAGLVALALIAAAVPPRFLAWNGNGEVPLNRAVVDPEAVSLAVVPGFVRAPDAQALSRAREPSQVDYRAALAVQGLPQGMVVRPLRLTGRITAGRETVSFDTKHSFVLVGASDVDPQWSGLQTALGDARLLTMPLRREADRARLGLAVVPVEDAQRLAAATQTMTADMELAAGRYREVAAVPLRPGARLTVSGRSFEILSVQPSSAQLVNVRTVNVSRATLGRFWWWTLCLRNREKHQAVKLNQSGYRSGTDGTLGMLGLWVGNGVSVLSLPGNEQPTAATDSKALTSIIDADWLAGAELVYLDVEDLGTFTRPLRVVFPAPGPA